MGPIKETLAPFIEDLQIQARGGGSTHDSRIAAYAEAAQESLRKNRTFKETVGYLLTEKKDTSPSHATNLVLRALQKQLMVRDDLYPLGYETPDPWKDAIQEVTEKDSEKYDEFFEDIMTRNIQSNIADRYKAFDLILHLYEERFDPHPTILDVGCSQNQGLKKMSLTDKYPFKDVEVVGSEADIVAPIKADSRLDHSAFNRLIRRLFSDPFTIGRSLGIDIVPADNPSNARWARSCSFYPSELLNAEKVREYDAIDAANPKNVSFYQGDFSRLDHEDFVKNAPNERYDLVTFSTVLYQVSPAKRKQMLENARQYVKPDGLIVVQDFVNVNRKDPTRLRFHKNWFKRPFLYTTIIRDPSDATGEMHEIFRWENGRCKKIKLLKDLGRISIDLKSLGLR